MTKIAPKKLETAFVPAGVPTFADLMKQVSAIADLSASRRRDIISVTYLDEKAAGNYLRAIGFRALTGPRAGFHDAVSADWLGPWIGVLLAPLCGLAALFKAYANKRPKAAERAPSLSITN